MIKTLETTLKMDREKYKIPRKIQDYIPIRRVWSDGMFMVGNKYAKTFLFSDINSSPPPGRIRRSCWRNTNPC